MQSPPTSPRRRGRLQPEPHGCGLGIDGAEKLIAARRWAAGPSPGRERDIFREEAAEEGTSPCDRSKQHITHPRLPQVDALTVPRQRGAPHSRKRRSILCGLSKFLAASSSVRSTNAKNDGCGQLVAGIGFLRLPASSTSALGNPDVSS